MEEIVSKFIEQYKVEFDYYSNLAELVRDECDNKLQSAGIKAITSWRAKNPDSLRLKLTKRDKDKNYQAIEDIRNDIADLAGVRIALYFPSEREAIEKLINELFIIKNRKIFPEQSQKPTYTKRFSGYWATHYRVVLKPNINNLRYSTKLVEIQVASVLMHSWSEIEHDLVYKPNNGKLSEEELHILDEINGLVMVGEIALERLQETMVDRINRKSRFDDSYELKNYLSKYIVDINSRNIGNIQYLNEIMNNISFNNKSKIRNIVSHLEYSPDSSIADELIDKIFIEAFKTEIDTNKIISLTKENAAKRSGFESFLKLWILLESINEYMMEAYNIENKSYKIKFDIYLKTEILNFQEVEQLKEFRTIRNYILHGVGKYEDDYLLNKYSILKDIVLKVINSLKAQDYKEKFLDEFKSIDN